MVCPVRVAKKESFSDHSRLPAVDHGLGDYTQWVHEPAPTGSGSTRHGPSMPSEKIQILRPHSTARSQLWSRGLHPVGALSVPPLVQRSNRHNLVDSRYKFAQWQIKTPSGCTNGKRRQMKRFFKESFQVAYPNRTSDKLKGQSVINQPGRCSGELSWRRKQLGWPPGPPSSAPS